MRGPASQRGVAVIAMVAVLVIAITAGIVSLVNAALNRPAAERSRNSQVLQQAKTALIGYVAKEVLDLAERSPGRLPCPESPGVAGLAASEGIAAPSCVPTFPTNKTVGRLPWRTLGLDKLVDAHAEPLWYAVSPNWVFDNVAYPIINSGTTGQLTVDGTANVVAVIIAPGAPLNTAPSAAQITAGCAPRAQQRGDRSHVAGSTADPDYRDYLECQNATFTPDTAFGSSVVDNATNVVLNDQVVFITAADLLNAIQGPLAERLQRTVAPLLNEFSTTWNASGTIRPTATNTPLTRFMPYAFPFAAPESAAAPAAHCGPTTAPVREGLLPVASMALTGGCESQWQSFAWTGSVGVTGSGCTTDAAGAVTCQFRYYTLRSITFPIVGPLNLFQILGLSSPATINVTLQASAPHAASTFRRTLAAADFTLNPTANITSATYTQTPSTTNGGANLSVVATISDTALCQDQAAPASAPSLNIVCSTLGTLNSVCAIIPALAPFCGVLGPLLTEALTTPNTVTLQFPALANPTLQGTQLSAAVMSGVATPINLLSPAVSDPHYWFFYNEWYRYTYYAVSPSASAAGTGGDLVVSGFPAEFGAATDKRFVLALMGPAVTGQTRGAAAPMNQYVEGANAVTSGSPRTFAYSVFGAPGNDRLATCPYTAVCN